MRIFGIADATNLQIFFVDLRIIVIYSFEIKIAQVAELVDAHGSGPCGAIRGGSSPLLGTKISKKFELTSKENYKFELSTILKLRVRTLLTR